jgi:hypothetical protein
MKKIHQTNFYTIIASVYPKRYDYSVAPTLHSQLCLKKHFLTLYILGYSDAVKLQRPSTAAVMNPTAL